MERYPGTQKRPKRQCALLFGRVSATGVQDASFGPLSKFFYFIFIFLYILMLFYRHKLPYRDVSDASRVYNLLLYIYLVPLLIVIKY